MFRTGLIAALILSLAGCRAVQPGSTRRIELVFDTPCSVTVFERGAGDVLDDVFAEMWRIESIMNAHDDESELSELNRRAGGEPLSVSSELYEVIRTGVAFGQVTGGAFDISIGPLVELWDIGGESPRVPSGPEIEEALDLVNYLDVLLLDYQNQVLLKRPGMKIDLGGIAKGYAADRAAEILSRHGVERAIIDFGGNIYVVGEREPDEPWRIGIQNPDEPRGNFIGIMRISNTAAVTSGPYERFFEFNGIRYHHILDTQTGSPVDNDLASVTILSDSALTADALSTAVFVLGIPSGMTLVENFDGVEAIVLTEDHGVYLTSGAGKVLNLVTEEYRIVQSAAYE